MTLLQQNLEQLFLQNAVLLGILTLVVLAIAKWQAGLNRREYRIMHLVKAAVAMKFDEWGDANGRSFVNRKKYRDDPEYVETVLLSPATVFDMLDNSGFDPHLVATTKVRRVPKNYPDPPWQIVYGQLVYDHPQEHDQTEVMLYRTLNGHTDVYVHVEGDISDPEEHLSVEVIPGDVAGVYDQHISEFVTDHLRERFPA